ncbi:hypothetical protein ACTXOJ_11390 [Glutamicibacter arilaitensis]|uniref:hypothetical protein n=1 Tax=Glutamicibacter arilaitensis TaxID=256701 RepID=UPI003FD37C82
MNTCGTIDCEAEAQDKYLCGKHTRYLQTELNKIPELLEDLFITMAKLDHTAPQRSEGGGGLSTGSAMPLRYGALELRQALGLWTHSNAEKLAQDHRAGNFLPMLSKLISDATDCIDNPPEVRVITTCRCGGQVVTEEPKPEDGKPDTGNCEICDEYYEQTAAMTRFRIHRATPEALRTRDAIKWIRDNAGISIKSTDIWNWQREGKITPTNRQEGSREHPTYNVADILKAHYLNVEKNRRATNF